MSFYAQGKRDDLALIANRKFYFNEIPSKPSGEYHFVTQIVRSFDDSKRIWKK